VESGAGVFDCCKQGAITLLARLSAISLIFYSTSGVDKNQRLNVKNMLYK
jgi:hypothetical protein